MPKDRIRFTLDVSPQMNVLVERLADEMGCSKSDVLRKSVVLLDRSHQAQKAGKRVGVAAEGQPLETEFVGL